MQKNLLLAFALLTAIFTEAQNIVNITTDITSDQNWTNNNIYVIEDRIYVTNNAVVTIQPGTIIKGSFSPQGALIIARGSKLVADGTPEQPIVFTSSQAAGSRARGDWGGVYIAGNGITNQGVGVKPEGGLDSVKANYGGTIADDSSGVLRYVRIEYAGYAYQANSELNGLTLGGIGSRTVLEHVMVSYANDDAIEWFGGTVNGKFLIANKTLDDMFDSDFGWQGAVQFALGVSDSTTADISGSNGFESDNNNLSASNYAGTPLTKGVFTNVTIAGPSIDANTTIHPNYKRALHLRRNTSLCIYNSVMTGFPTGLKIENQPTADNITNNSLEFKNNIIAGSTTPLDSSTLAFGMEGWFSSNGNSILANSTDINLADAYNYYAPNFLPQNGSPLLSGASFTSPNLSGNSYITSTTYRGAFDGTNDWTKCWSEWDPQNANYESAINYGFTVNITPSGSLPSVTLTADNVSGATYSWSNGGNAASTTVNTTGTYTVTVTSSRGCTKTQSIDVLPTGISKSVLEMGVQLFPNPNNGEAILKISAKENVSVNISIRDVAGHTLFSSAQQLVSGINTVQLNTTTFANGIYFVNVSSESGSNTLRMAVNR